MFQLGSKIENAVKISRSDLQAPLSSCSEHPIVLENQNWATCEHYVQTKCLRSDTHIPILDKLLTGAEVIKYAKPWYRFKIKNYQTHGPIFMTRALYTKVQMYDEVKQALLATEDKLIVETSQYDYFWGIGRDLRGHNHLGKAWMNIRDKLNQSGAC